MYLDSSIKNTIWLFFAFEWHCMCFLLVSNSLESVNKSLFVFKILRIRQMFCLFAWVLSSHSRIFHPYGDVTITGERLQILTYARHSWPLSSEGSLACHTYYDTERPFIMVISEDPWHSHLLPSDSNTQPSACGTNVLTHCKNANNFDPTFHWDHFASFRRTLRNNTRK